MGIAPALLTRLEKAAVDNGFDQVLAPAAPWLAYGSSRGASYPQVWADRGRLTLQYAKE
ncbi:MAG: hypothetical protein M0Z94_16300 [Dehalococcoidales bacterium]|nr:hypothetical protein [Dehalococcoidales bacterium]